MPSLKERFDVRTQRELTLSGYTLLIVGLALVVLIVVLVELTSKSDDKLAIVANWLAAGTLALALLASLVALQAYANASGQPDLKVQLQFPSAHPNEPRFVVSENVAYSSCIEPESQTLAAIVVKNDSLYAARAPAIQVSLKYMAIERSWYSPGSDWVGTQALGLEGGIVTLQWDSIVPIHGKTQRHAIINMKGLHRIPGGQPTITIKLMADGYWPRDVVYMSVFDTEGTPGQPPKGPSKTPEWL